MIFNRRIPTWFRIAYYYESLGAFFYGISFGLSTSFFNLIARKIGISTWLIALLTSSVFFGSLLSYPWLKISVRIRKIPFVVTMKSIARALLFLFLLPRHSPPFYVTIIFIYWILEMGSNPAYWGIIKEIYPENHRGKAMGYVRVEMAIAILLSSYAGGWLLDRISYRFVFPLGAFFGLIALNFFRRIPLKESINKFSKPEEDGYFQKGLEILKEDKVFRKILIALFLLGSGYLLSAPLFPVFLVDILNVSNFTAGKLTALYSLFWIVSYGWWGEFMDKKKSPLLTFLLSTPTFVLFPFLHSIAFNLFPVYLAYSLSGFLDGGFELGKMGLITRLATRDKVQFYSAIDYTLMGIRGSILPFVGIGLAKILALRGVFLLSTLLASIGIYLTFQTWKYQKYLKGKPG